MGDNLPELRDIHLPDGVSWFPPAYGWFVLVLCVLLVWCGYRLFRMWRLTSRKVYALKLLSAQTGLSPIIAGRQISEILRRICVLRYPAAAALVGEHWLQFLLNHTKDKLSASAAELLLNAPYIPENSTRYSRTELNELREFARRWIGENL